MQFHLKIWRQSGQAAKGHLVKYELDDVSPDMSFLEMLDALNRDIITAGGDPVAYDHDCREGICGMCSLVINGMPHGPGKRKTTCQLYMRQFQSGTTIVVEPFRAGAFPIIKDLVVDRSAFDEIIVAGGYISVNTGSAQDANAILIPKERAELSMNAASCIGCGACVASCKNASAMLFVAAKVSHLSLLPQGEVEQQHRVLSMVRKMDELGFGNCSNEGACEVVCPKGISLENIARMNRQYLSAAVLSRDPEV